jgi:hypothetical protein
MKFKLQFSSSSVVFNDITRPHLGHSERIYSALSPRLRVITRRDVILSL